MSDLKSKTTTNSKSDDGVGVPINPAATITETTSIENPSDEISSLADLARSTKVDDPEMASVAETLEAQLHRGLSARSTRGYTVSIGNPISMPSSQRPKFKPGKTFSR